jgi:hypothetical protein
MRRRSLYTFAALVWFAAAGVLFFVGLAHPPPGFLLSAVFLGIGVVFLSLGTSKGKNL